MSVERGGPRKAFLCSFVRVFVVDEPLAVRTCSFCTFPLCCLVNLPTPSFCAYGQGCSVNFSCLLALKWFLVAIVESLFGLLSRFGIRVKESSDAFVPIDISSPDCGF